jgi:hypothetical protein
LAILTHLLCVTCDQYSTKIVFVHVCSHKVDVTQEYRVEGEGSEQPPESPSEPDIVSEGAVGGGESEGAELASAQQQSCECHVCTAPLMTPVSIVLELRLLLTYWGLQL